MTPSPSKYFSMENFFQKIAVNSGLFMVWGDIGTGKTTLALELSKRVLNTQKKVFYLNSKESSYEKLYERILGEGWQNPSSSNFHLWNEYSSSSQTICILNFLIQLKKLETLFKENRVGLIVIDEIANQYLLEMSYEKHNSELNKLLLLQMATLKKISIDYQIPIILLNTFSVKFAFEHKKDMESESIEGSEDIKYYNRDENKNEDKVVPHGGKLIDYWVDLSLKINRTSRTSMMDFKLEKNIINLSLPSSWVWKLTSNGFDSL